MRGPRAAISLPRSLSCRTMELMLIHVWLFNMCAPIFAARDFWPSCLPCCLKRDRQADMQVLQKAAALVEAGQPITGCSMVAVDPDSNVKSAGDTLQWDRVRGTGDPWGWNSSTRIQPGSQVSACGMEQQSRECWKELVASVDRHIQERDAAAVQSQQAAGSHAHQQNVWLAINSMSTLVVYYSISVVSGHSPSCFRSRYKELLIYTCSLRFLGSTRR